MTQRYEIHELSAKAIMRSARLGEDGVYRFSLGEEATQKCISISAPKTQDDCALFYQIMQEIKHPLPPQGMAVRDLADILIYIDFSGIFDRRPSKKKYADYQKLAEDMFRPEGVGLDFGRGLFRYIAFERSASMSRRARLSFIREDYYEPVKERITLGMKIGVCQLSKLYAYNGLMLTSGVRMDDLKIWDPKKVIVVDNPVRTMSLVNAITVRDDGSSNAVRKYSRDERLMNVDITRYDGEGLISPSLAGQIDAYFSKEHIHSSFQIRMPYIKGVVHEVDFRNLFFEIGVYEIKDIWGTVHPVEEIEMILTKSMFKGFGWMTENGLSWAEYLARCEKYDHALYVSEVGKESAGNTIELNYQFLNTAAIRQEEFRPADLPLGWDAAPEEDARQWITKATESEYYHLVADDEYRIKCFTESAEGQEDQLGKEALWAKILTKNPLFINEPVFTKQLESKAEKVLKNYAIGRLTAAGDNRYLSDDLMWMISDIAAGDTYDYPPALSWERLREGEVYAPKAEYAECESYTLLRNPHIARNEEAVARPLSEPGVLREKYLSHLSYVVMVSSDTLIPERLGGADYDGDMVKTVADPLVNKCIARNYRSDVSFDYVSIKLPLLKIPAAEPLLRDAEDWKARFETVKNTFNSRIGQICNAAFDRSIVAYDENSSKEERSRLMKETEVLEILTGLEIDSAKSGVKPDLTEYLSRKIVSRSPFLKYKNITEEKDGREWYEPTRKEKLDKYFASVDWDSVSSNVEKLPYYARMLEKHTKKIQAQPAADEELFSFAGEDGWKDRLDPYTLKRMTEIIDEYDSALRRIRLSRLDRKTMTRKSDIERILFMRGQENDYTADELYGVLKDLDSRKIARIRSQLTEKKWHLMDMKEREIFLLDVIPSDLMEDYEGIFTDFRKGGYRILGDIICDLDDMYRIEDQKALKYRSSEGRPLEKRIIEGYAKNPSSDYRDDARRAVIWEMSHGASDRDGLDFTEALKCVISLGRRDFALEIMPYYILDNMVVTENIKKRRKHAGRKRRIFDLH